MLRSWRGKLPYLAMIVLKLALVAGLPMTALTDAGYDDALFVQLGKNVTAGQWLGDYNFLTLAKGPIYSIFLAIAYHLRLPVPLAQQLLYVVFCVVMIVALRSAIPSPAGRIFLFAILLFNPISFGTNQMARAIREGIYPALTGLVIACAVGIALRPRGPLANLYGWAAGLGFTLGIFWLTREEGVWIFPALACLLGWAVVRMLRPVPVDWIKRLAALGLAGAIAPGVVCIEAGVNHWKYREFVTVEFREPAFVAAYGALTRVTPAEYKARVPVAKETRQRIYAISPAFAELKPFLEGDLGYGWEESSEKAYPQFPGEIVGGWFTWALREAVSAAGHAGSAKAAHRFYQQLAEQVNAACDSGRIAAGPRRDTIMPAWQWKLLPRVATAAQRGIGRLITFSQPTVDIPISTGTPEMLASFHSFLHSPISDRPLDRFDAGRLRVIGWIDGLYQFIGPIWIAASLVVFGLLCVSAFAKRGSILLIPAAALLIAILVRVAILAIIDASSFPSMLLIYLSCLHPLMLLFAGLMTLEAVRLVRQNVLSGKPQEVAEPVAAPAFRFRLIVPFAVLILAKLVLAGALPMTALPTYGYDEGLFVRLAAQLSAGNWLGPYGPVTLVKGAGYPIFIVVAHQVGISLSLAHQLLYVFFCVAMIIALAPVIRSRWKRLFLFTLILFNPASFPIYVFDNANREGIYPALTGLIFAGAVGMAVRYNRSTKKLLAWAVSLGLTLGFFWITREEGMWIVPSLALVLGAGAVAVLRSRPCEVWSDYSHF